MSIVRRQDPESTPSESGGITDTYTRQNTLTDLLFLQSPGVYFKLTGTDEVPKGLVFSIGGTEYECTADEAITGTPSNFVVFSPSLDGSTATAAYISLSTFNSDFEWNDSYNGYYNGDGHLCICDEFKEAADGNISSPKLITGIIGKHVGGSDDFDSGQNANSGDSLLQTIGETLRTETKSNLYSVGITTDEDHDYIRRTTRPLSLTSSLQWWHLASISSGYTNQGECRITAYIDIPSIGRWVGTLEISSGGLAGTEPIIRVINSSRSYALTNYQYEPQFRALYPASGTDTGIYIQVGVKSSGTETGSIVYYMNENAVFSDSVLGFNIHISSSGTADGTPTYLPDGATAPVAGVTVYGFGIGKTVIWTGSESVSNSHYFDNFFTNFSNQIFNQYIAESYYVSVADYCFNLNILKPKDVSSLSIASGSGASFIMLQDGETYDFDFLVASGYTDILINVYGVIF
jgi:hypothetical protein